MGHRVHGCRPASGRHLDYLNWLTDRLHALRFDPTDPVCRTTVKAWDEVNALCMAQHYAGCEA